MKVGSLFAGIGGFDLAAERAGMTVEWQSEIDSAASKVLEHHWPGKNVGDIHDITLSDQNGSQKRATDVDVLCGGFPCQDYSVAGLREGLAGDRGALWWKFHRLIDEGRPTWVVGENVPGLLNSRGGTDFATIVESLTQLGYGVAWGVLDAQYFGVAQRRRRVFIVGHSGGVPRPEILALGEGLFGHPAPSRDTRQSVAPTLATRTGDSSGYRRDTDLGNGLVTNADPAYSLTSRGAIDRPEDGYSTLIADTLRSHPRPGSATSGAIVATGFAWQAGGDRSAADTLEDELSPTLHVGQSMAVHNKMNVRRLTPLECERLQGFPPAMMVDMSAARDELAATALAAGHLIADADTGKVYRTRGPGGRILSEIVEWGTAMVNGCGIDSSGMRWRHLLQSGYFAVSLNKTRHEESFLSLEWPNRHTFVIQVVETTEHRRMSSLNITYQYAIASIK